MSLYEFIGPWLYWPTVVIVIAGAFTWTLNCISVAWSEGLKQITELTRVSRRKPTTPEQP